MASNSARVLRVKAEPLLEQFPIIHWLSPECREPPGASRRGRFFLSWRTSRRLRSRNGTGISRPLSAGQFVQQDFLAAAAAVAIAEDRITNGTAKLEGAGCRDKDCTGWVT